MANSALPNRKVGASAIAGALTILLVAILKLYIPIDVEVASAITTLITFGVGYFVPEPAA